MSEIIRSCPDCNYKNTFTETKGYTISPIVCERCHALLRITFEDDWEFEVIDRIELRHKHENSD